MRFAIIKAGFVTNVVLADATAAASIAAMTGGTAVASDTASPGDAYAAGVFACPSVETPVPPQVTRRQLRQALLLAGRLDDVQPVIDGITDTTQRALAQIEWDDSEMFDRHGPLLLSIALALGLTSAQMDELFRNAATL